MHAVREFFRFAHIDGLIVSGPPSTHASPRSTATSPAPRAWTGLKLIRFLQVTQTISVHHGALTYLLGIDALCATEAAAVRIEDYAETPRGHRVLHLVGKGNKPATMPLTVPVLRVPEACRGERTAGPLILRPMTGKPIDRLDACRMVARIARAAGILRHISPYSLRHAAITNALDAGVPLRDAQILARHADPRTTEHYDRARLHSRLSRWQLATTQWHDGSRRTSPTFAATPTTSRGAPVSPSPSSTQATTTSFVASTCIPRPPTSRTSWCNPGCGPTDRASTYHSPTSHAGSPPTGPGSAWTAAVAES
jgi:site-specific recombinase XerD